MEKHLENFSEIDRVAILALANDTRRHTGAIVADLLGPCYHPQLVPKVQISARLKAWGAMGVTRSMAIAAAYLAGMTAGLWQPLAFVDKMLIRWAPEAAATATIYPISPEIVTLPPLVPGVRLNRAQYDAACQRRGLSGDNFRLLHNPAPGGSIVYELVNLERLRDEKKQG